MTLTPETPALRSARQAMRALSANEMLDVEVRHISNSTEFQALLNDLLRLERPFGICIARLKDPEDGLDTDEALHIRNASTTDRQ